MRVVVNSHALPVYKTNRIATLLCIFETAILMLHFIEIRTSDSLNEGLPIKIARQKFHRKRLFFHQKDSRLNSRIIRKRIFLIGQAPIQKYGLKTLFLLFNI